MLLADSKKSEVIIVAVYFNENRPFINRAVVQFQIYQNCHQPLLQDNESFHSVWYCSGSNDNI